jgi:hypothetical protein
MDVGAKDEPGRELDANGVRDVSGGHVAPDLDDPPGGCTGGQPVDYGAVSGGADCVAPPPPNETQPQPANPIWKALEDAWNGIVK